MYQSLTYARVERVSGIMRLIPSLYVYYTRSTKEGRPGGSRASRVMLFYIVKSEQMRKFVAFDGESVGSPSVQ